MQTFGHSKKTIPDINMKSISAIYRYIAIFFQHEKCSKSARARQERAVANKDEVAMTTVHEIMELWTKMCVADTERHQV
jgi:hypothetical protein